jgi:hypothetical protein
MVNTMKVHFLRNKIASFWTERKMEIFFGCVALLALSQVVRREMHEKKRMKQMLEETPQRAGRVQLGQPRPGAPSTEWGRRKE